MHELAASALPLDQHQDSRLQDAVSGLTPAQLQWVSGYAAGLAASGVPVDAPPDEPARNTTQQLTVLVGSQTGNCEHIARNLVARAQERGFDARAVNLADFKPTAIKRESLVTLVISTHGEGDPPDDAELFHGFLMSDKAPPLANLRYSVLALGDSSYVNFCQTGREFDERLAELGAERFADLKECDLDFDEHAATWSQGVIDRLPSVLDQPGMAGPKLHAVTTASEYSRNSPLHAEVLTNQKITGAGSSKDVRHIELSFAGSHLSYEPGDSLAVLTTNPPQLVDEILDVLAFQDDILVDIEGESVSLGLALAEKLEITTVSMPFLKKWAARGSDELRALIETDDAAQLSDFVASHQVIDILRRYPVTTDANSFVKLLRPLTPRSYSIASSLAANPDEVHLTVAAVRYEAFGRPHWGAASTMLADRLEEGARASVFVEKNSRFRLPGSEVPIIMIGPGTGVAPFRAFIEERVEQGATGDSWLFFGDRNFSHDFLYQLEWQRHLKNGGLTRLDVSFSRDQDKKVYVQDRLRARGAEVYGWIERGAVIYVCGDARHMAGDVEDALVSVLEDHGGMDRDAAQQRLKSLRRERRYQRDVY